MANVKVRNTTGRQHDLTFRTGTDDEGRPVVVSHNIPPRVGEGKEAKDGEAVVDGDMLAKALKKDPVVQAWFDDGHLVIDEGKKKTAVEDGGKNGEKKDKT